MYGRGVSSIAEQINGTIEEAQQIVDNFYKSFPKVKEWIDASEEFAKKTGYVEDLWGRRRRLPDIKLPKFTVRYKDKKTNLGSLNPFLGCKNRETEDKLIIQYTKEAESCKSKKQIDSLKLKAEKDGIEIINNGGFISTAQRQCVNARIQGSAATMTKKAMIKIHNDAELKKLGFRLEIGVHDELIGECPKENIERVAELLTYDMKTCAQDSVSVPFKCDPDYSYNWYFNSYCAIIKKEYVDLINGNEKKNIQPISKEEAFNKILEEHSELSVDNIKEVIYRDFSTQSDEDWEEILENGTY